MRVEPIVPISPQPQRPFHFSEQHKQRKKVPVKSKSSFQDALTKELKSTFNQYA